MNGSEQDDDKLGAVECSVILVSMQQRAAEVSMLAGIAIACVDQPVILVASLMWLLLCFRFVLH